MHRMNHISKEGFETVMLIGAQIAGKKPRQVREYPTVGPWLVAGSRLIQGLLAGALENGEKFDGASNREYKRVRRDEETSAFVVLPGQIGMYTTI
jgi:hypothetical protein